MRNLFAALTLCLLATNVAAGTFSFLETPYQLLDEIVMLAWKPLINLILIGWAKKAICSGSSKLIIDAADLSSGLTDDELTTQCEEGVDMFRDQFFYRGLSYNKPYSFGWAWAPADDF